MRKITQWLPMEARYLIETAIFIAIFAYWWVFHRRDVEEFLDEL